MTRQEVDANSAAGSVRERSWLTIVLSVVGSVIAGLAWVAVALWVVGRVLTDQYEWSQWLWWIPTPAMAPVCTIGLVAAMRPILRCGKRKVRLAIWLFVLCSLGVYFSMIEHRLLVSPPQSEAGLVIAHWNLSHPGSTELDAFAEAAAAIDADVLILSSPAGVGRPANPVIREGDDRKVLGFGVFTVVTDLPVLGGRPLVRGDEIWSFMIELDTRVKLGRTTILYMVDLPSDRSIHRMMVARSFRELLVKSGAPPPDIVVGDFNIPRGSESLKVMFPELHHAWDDGGYGYSGTFSREYPYMHIDHVLVNEALHAEAYGVFDPGIGRHRAQRAQIVPAR